MHSRTKHNIRHNKKNKVKKKNPPTGGIHRYKYSIPVVTLFSHKQQHSKHAHTGCPGGNVPDFGRMFLKLKYTDITKNTYI